MRTILFKKCQIWKGKSDNFSDNFRDPEKVFFWCMFCKRGCSFYQNLTQVDKYYDNFVTHTIRKNNSLLVNSRSQCYLYCRRDGRESLSASPIQLGGGPTSHQVSHSSDHRRYFSTFKEPRNLLQGIDSASPCSLAGWYDNPVPTRFLAPVDC